MRRRRGVRSFLADMQVIVPWAELTAVVEPFYPKISEAGGRPPLPLERMLRVYFLQLWFNLSDPAVEEELYDSASMRRFAGIDLGVEAAPDETTVCKFRHLLEKNKLGEEAAEHRERRAPAAPTASRSRPGRSSMRRLSGRRVRRRIKRANATPRCIRPRKGSNGTSA